MIDITEAMDIYLAAIRAAGETLKKRGNTMKLANGVKELELSRVKLVFYYANNAGRGTDNVTIYKIDIDTPRAGCCKEQEKLPYMAVTKTSGWSGNVNFSKNVRARLKLL